MSAGDDVARLARWLEEARSIVGFTGAGISTESGIPDFRSPGSPWLTHKPIPYDVFVASEAARREAWRRKFAIDDQARGVKPSTGHLFLARLVATGRSPGVITQNIDGLHQASGIPDDKVVELHGNGTYARCLACGARHELGDVRRAFEASGAAPRCTVCDGPVKSGTVSFGQAMPQEAMSRAKQLTENADIFLAIGSSLVVYPAAGFPILAKRNGSRLVIINREPTELDELADLVINDEIGTVFSRINR